MTDIVHWLRKLADLVDEGHDPHHVVAHMREAADEIDRLRAALLEIRDAGPMTVDDQRWRIARAAMEGK